MELLAIPVMLAMAVLVLHIVYRPPPLAGRSVSSALRLSAETRLGRLVLSAAPHHPHDSGVVALDDGRDAFAARVALIREADHALDIQYYIWQRDLTGLLLMNELRQAAARGVRIRLLLDDNGIPGLDPHLAELDALPGIEVRLFNPFILRRPKVLGFLFDFVRLNRRMHNKLMVADGAAAILGGRNVGDVYFAYGPGRHNLDTDVLAIGQVADEAGADFDRYWASQSAYPARLILPPPPPEGVIDAELTAACAQPGAVSYAKAVAERPLTHDIASGRAGFVWAPVTLISDDPAKGLGRLPAQDLMIARLAEMLANPARSVDIVSPYFVPGHRFTRRLVQLAAEGCRVRVFTNSQEATNQLVVHSAYVKYRPALIDGGVQLYEMRASPDRPPEPRTTGSSASHESLHSKTISVDDEKLFIGSFNFDPRSVFLNTEMGVVIDSPQVARAMTRMLDDTLPAFSYAPARNASGRIVWREQTADGPEIERAREPGARARSRATLWLMGRLPIEWLL